MFGALSLLVLVIQIVTGIFLVMHYKPDAALAFLSIGPNTEFKIDKYQFQPQNDQLELNASIIKGTLHYISGVIAKLKPDAVAVTTPTGVIAVRGTRFLVKIE